MWRVAALFWVFIAPVLAGALVLAVLLCPALGVGTGKWIAGAAVVGALIAMPVAWMIARSFAVKTA